MQADIASQPVPLPVREPAADDDVWTSWSTDSTSRVKGLLVLSKVRKGLLANNLHDPHLSWDSYGKADCSSDAARRYRSADGSCTDMANPMVGAAGTAFGRNVPPEYIDKKATENLMTPNPSDVSKVMFTRDEFKPVPFLNMLAAAWIQFMNHDWLTHGKNVEGNPYQVAGAGAASEVERTKVNPHDARQYKPAFGKTTLNDVTHWWDGSQIYGSSLDELKPMRAFRRGKMKTVTENGRELLPADMTLNIASNKQGRGRELTGFRDNWWLGLSLLHSLFVKEHNAIADMLLKKHVSPGSKPGTFIWRERKFKPKNLLNLKNLKETFVKTTNFDSERALDEHVFQTARLINAAVMAKIHTVEWTPAILPNETLSTAMHANWYGLANPKTWSKGLSKLSGLPNKTDWFGATKSGYLIGGVVGDTRNDFGVPFSITEEFTSVYRLHSLLPENLNIRTLRNPSQVEAVPFIESRNEKAYEIMKNHELKDLFYSFGTQNPGQLVLNNYPKFMQNLDIKGHGKMDLGMVDVLRDRERGVPRYNQFRRAIGLKPIRTYEDFFPGGRAVDERQKNIVANLTNIYGPQNVEMIDLLVGTLAEEVRPSKFGFGETMFQIFIVMASRRLMADRFYTDNYSAEYYTKAGLDWIDEQGTLAKVIARHMPETAPKMVGIESAFNPWKP